MNTMGEAPRIDAQRTEGLILDRLDALKVRYEHYTHHPVHTIDECLDLPYAEEDVTFCKNILLCNRQQDHFYLLMIKEDKKFKTKEISQQIHSARLSFAGAEFMEKFLDITPGAVSVMGLMNDHDNQVRLLVDEEVLSAEYVGCHPCVNTSSIRLKTRDVFERFLPAVGHTFQSVVLKGED